jgi:hypothetical protein
MLSLLSTQLTLRTVCSDSLTTASVRREVCRTVGIDVTLEVLDVVPGQRQTYGASLRALLGRKSSKTTPRP